MKVLHILDLSLPDLKGYAIRAKGIVESQKKIGMEPVCLTSFRQTKYDGEREVINNIVYYRSGRFKTRWKIPFLNQFDEIAALSKKIDYVIEQEKVDILHAHSPLLCGMAAVRAGKKHCLPVVYEIRAFWEDAAVSSGKSSEGDLRYMTTRFLETLVCKRADNVVAICEGIKRDLLERGINNDKIAVVPNGIVLDEFRELTRSTTLAKKHELDGFFVLGFIGSFFKFEGVDLLVMLMNELRHEPVKLVLVGEGETFYKIRTMVEELGLLDRVIMTGNVPHAEVQEYYSIVDVLIYPRYSERITELTTPLKPLEAMAMRKNVIISDVGGLMELVPEGCGEVFAAGDVASLLAKVKRVISMENLRQSMIKNASAFVVTRDWLEVVNTYRDVYQGIS